MYSSADAVQQMAHCGLHILFELWGQSKDSMRKHEPMRSIEVQHFVYMPLPAESAAEAEAAAAQTNEGSVGLQATSSTWG